MSNRPVNLQKQRCPIISCDSRMTQWHFLNFAFLLQVLFLKCSDLANVFRTVSLFPSIEHLELHLVDSSLLSVARNILIAAIASAPDFNVHNEEDLWFLFDVWYNSLWTVETAKRFTREVIHAMSEGEPKGYQHKTNLGSSRYCRLLRVVVALNFMSSDCLKNWFSNWCTIKLIQTSESRSTSRRDS